MLAAMARDGINRFLGKDLFRKQVFHYEAVFLQAVVTELICLEEDHS